jgi:phenylalanyl-tRNA synthetase beta chain
VESLHEYEEVKGGLKGLVIGEVISTEKHPNADKLTLTKVNIGRDELLSIVCGAPNVAAGQKVVVATVGTTIYPTTGEPLTMKIAKIRGQESQGMICAEDEIGLGMRVFWFYRLMQKWEQLLMNFLNLTRTGSMK